MQRSRIEELWTQRFRDPTSFHRGYVGNLRSLHLQPHRRFLDRHVYQRRADGEDDVYDPDGVVAAGHREHFATKPCAEETADLVCQQHETEERGHVAGAEQFRD